MTKSDIITRIIKTADECNIIINYSFESEEKLEYDLKNIPFEVDSIHFLTFLTKLEKEFNIVIDDDHWGRDMFPKLSDIFDYILNAQ